MFKPLTLNILLIVFAAAVIVCVVYLDDYISILSIVLPVALVLVTVLYTSATNEMVAEMRRTREEEYRPEVVVDFDTDPRKPFFVYLKVQNLGRRMARDVEFVFNPEPTTLEGKEIAKVGCFEKGLAFLSPYRQLHIFYEHIDNLLREDSQSTKTFEVTVKYKDILKRRTSERVECYQDTFLLDSQQFMGQIIFHRKTSDKSLEEISKQIGTIATKVSSLDRKFEYANYGAIATGREAYYRERDDEERQGHGA